MRILLTRPETDSARTAAALREHGHAAIIAPLLTIEILPDAQLGRGPWSAILVTSANAVRAIAGHKRADELHGIAVFTVGKHSARDMRAIGFRNVSSADGDVDHLAALVAASVETGASLLYLAGEERAGDLAGVLRAQHFAVQTAVVYRAVAVDRFPDHAMIALAAGIDGVLHYSRRSAEAFLTAAHHDGLLEAALTKPVHYCLSPRVAEPLMQAGAAKVRIAARPDEAALLALCD